MGIQSTREAEAARVQGTGRVREDSPARQALRAQLAAAFPIERAPTIYDALRDPPAPRSRATDDVDSPLLASDKLERGVDKALDRLSEAMDVNPENFITEEGRLGAWRVIVSAAEKLVTAQVRVDQNRLRRREQMNGDEIMKRLKQIEQGLPTTPVLELEAS